jgi:hypothetical protein
MKGMASRASSHHQLDQAESCMLAEAMKIRSSGQEKDQVDRNTGRFWP